MQRLLIHCQGEPEQGEKMKTFIETRLPYTVDISFDKQITREIVTQRAMHLMVYDTPAFQESDLRYLNDLRGQGFNYPSLIVAQKIEIPNFLQVIEKFKSHYLEKPFEYRALRGIVQKMMTARQVPQQLHKRFQTQQNALMETYISGEVITSQMFNLSVGGAYVEYNTKSKLAVGDLVRLKVNLNDLSREHSMNARVVWTTRKGMVNGGNGIGVRFIKGNDIYRQLIDKV